MADENEARE